MYSPIIQEAKRALTWLLNTHKDDKNVEEAIQKLEKEEQFARSMKKATWMSICKLALLQIRCALHFLRSIKLHENLDKYQNI